jgi:hypothetical protein
MKTRIHIHTEDGFLDGAIRHFLIHLPDEAGEIIAIRASAVAEWAPIPAPPPDVTVPQGHLEVGRLRLWREGFLLCNMQVVFDVEEAPMTMKITPPGALDQETATRIAGTKQEPLYLKVEPGAGVLFCKYENNSLEDYRLKVYVVYKTRER